MGRVYCGPIYNLGREKVAKEEPEGGGGGEGGRRRRREGGRRGEKEECKVKKQNLTQGVRKKLSQERTLTERVSYFLFVLMSVSGGVHGDFLKPFRKSPALCGVSFKCLV